jgi:hypothetical protein
MGYEVLSDSEIRVNLNLIGFNNLHNWEVRVNIGESYYLSHPFDVELGPAIIAGYNTFGDTRAAIYIYRTLRSWPYYAYSYETGTVNDQKAWAQERRSARFYVRGMGFPINGSTTLRIWGWSGSYSGSYSCTMDRAARIVRIESDLWDMPNVSNSSNYNISVQANGYAASEYTARWRIRE